MAPTSYKHFHNPESAKYTNRAMGQYFPLYTENVHLTPREERGYEELPGSKKFLDVYQLQAMVKEYLLGNRVTDIYKKYSITKDEFKGIRDIIDNDVPCRYPRMHFTYLITCDSPIIKPDYRLQWPFNPCGISKLVLGPSYSFYKVPDAISKNNKNIYYDTYSMRLMDGAFLEWLMNSQLGDIHQLFNGSFTNFSHPLLGRYREVAINALTLNQARYIAMYLIRSPEIYDGELSVLGHTIREGRYNNDSQRHSPGALSSSLWCDNEALVLDSPVSYGRMETNWAPQVPLYKGIWIEEYIKRTMWDRLTEHSLIVFDDCLKHKRTHLNSYLHMPIKIRSALDRMGVKQQDGSDLNPVFDYVVSENLTPFKDLCTIYHNKRNTTIVANFNAVTFDHALLLQEMTSMR